MFTEGRLKCFHVIMDCLSNLSNVLLIIMTGFVANPFKFIETLILDKSCQKAIECFMWSVLGNSDQGWQKSHIKTLVARTHDLLCIYICHSAVCSFQVQT